MFDWEDMRHFIALAETGTLSGAARALKVDHATVGRRVSALEQALGGPLIERLPKRWVLTEKTRSPPSSCAEDVRYISGHPGHGVDGARDCGGSGMISSCVTDSAP